MNASRRFRASAAAATVTLAVLALLITLFLKPGQPHFSKQQVIAAALKGYAQRQFPRVEAKLMHRQDLERATSEVGQTNGNELIWVVAVSGNYGITPSFGCCGVPSDYPGHNTWGIAIIVDSAPTPEPREFESSYHGDWPPFFDGLPDLAMV